MAEFHKDSEAPAERRRVLAEELWLLYFNQTLFAKGIITESQRNRMAHLLSRRP